MAKKRKSGRKAWQKKFAKVSSKCHRTTKSPREFGRCMSKHLKK